MATLYSLDYSFLNKISIAAMEWSIIIVQWNLPCFWNQFSFPPQFSSVQTLSRAQLFATPCIAARQASLIVHKVAKSGLDWSKWAHTLKKKRQEQNLVPFFRNGRGGTCSVLGAVLSCWCLTDIVAPNLSITEDRISAVAAIWQRKRDVHPVSVWLLSQPHFSAVLR